MVILTFTFILLAILYITEWHDPTYPSSLMAYLTSAEIGTTIFFFHQNDCKRCSLHHKDGSWGRREKTTPTLGNTRVNILGHLNMILLISLFRNHMLGTILLLIMIVKIGIYIYTCWLWQLLPDHHHYWYTPIIFMYNLRHYNNSSMPLVGKALDHQMD